jgi:hypothetical protein
MMEPISMTSPSPAPAARAPVQLRPLSTGELIDRGFSLYRAHFAGFLLLALICQIAPLLMSHALLMGIGLFSSPGSFSGTFNLNPLTVAVNIALFIIGQIVTFALEVVMTVYLVDTYFGKNPSIKTAFGAFFRKFGASALTSLLNMILVTVTFFFPIFAGLAIGLLKMLHPPESLYGSLFFVGTAILALVISFVPVLIVFIRIMLTVPAVALENLGGWKAVKRSSELVRYDPGLGFFYWGETRLSLLLLPLFVIQALALSITSLPLWLHQINDILRSGSIGQVTAPPETALILSQVLVLLTTALIFPLFVVATTLFYYDVRIRREGFDLEFMAGRMEGGG